MGVKQSLTPRKEHKLKIFENRVLRRIFGTKREESGEAEEDYTERNFITCTLLQILLG
jgi:hypothetical protein